VMWLIFKPERQIPESSANNAERVDAEREGKSLM